MTADIAAHYRAQCLEDADCLLWQGKVNRAGAPIGRGSVRRAYWEATKGRIPNGKLPHPSCGNRRCLEHLELTTLSEVMRKTIAKPDVKARWKVATKNRGKKLDMETARAIRESTLSQRELAKKHNVAQGLISRIKANLLWTENQPFNPFQGL